MPKAKLTKRFIESLPFDSYGGQTVYTDIDLPGFGLVVGATAKSYFAQKDIKGKTVRVTIGKHGVFTPEQAREEAKELLVRMAKGENPNSTKRQTILAQTTLAEAIESYKAAKKHQSKTTIYHLDCCTKRWLSDWTHTPLTSITKDMVFKRHIKIANDCGEATANIAMRMLRTLYNFALQTNDSLPPNPVRTLSLTGSWFEDARRQTLIKPTQLKAWHEAVMLVDNSGIREYLYLLLFTGMRKNEGLSLRWENIDFKERVITVPLTKSGRPLVLPMSQYVYDLLQMRKKRTGESAWVFPSTGKTGHLVEPRKTVEQLVKKSGVKFMLHDLRRTFITIAESLDISAYAVKQLVNHSQRGDVTAGYVVMNIDRLREPMEKIAQYIISQWNKNDE